MDLDTIHESSWDVVISGTGLPQSLLALALSRSGKKILHVDRNSYYGGEEAALSLSEAEIWAKEHSQENFTGKSSFSHAAVTQVSDDQSGTTKISPSRAYSLSLAPQLLYTRSALLPALVSSKTHNQLEFQAVGSWFIVSKAADAEPSKLIRVPGGREDIFQDDTLDLKSKRSLMKFLRFVANYEEQSETWVTERSKPFSAFLEEKFGLPRSSHAPILALTMSTSSLEGTTVELAVPNIARHLSSIGLFGPGFGAVLPKWGGLAEIGQVACRASAVGGAVYVLGRGVSAVQQAEDSKPNIELSDGSKVTTQWLAGTTSEIPGNSLPGKDGAIIVSKTIFIVSSPLHSLFPSTSEGGVTPAGAVIFIPPGDDHEPPIHIFAHSGEAGECPSTQCILYASVALDHTKGFPRLTDAVTDLLKSFGEGPSPQVLWSLQYQQHYPPIPADSGQNGALINLRSISPELALADDILEDVKVAWQQITNDDPASFMKFEARERASEDDD